MKSNLLDTSRSTDFLLLIFNPRIFSTIFYSCDFLLHDFPISLIFFMISQNVNILQINFICCAKALCNLACAEEARLRVAKEGGMHALMMISMVSQYLHSWMITYLNNLLTFWFICMIYFIIFYSSIFLFALLFW